VLLRFGYGLPCKFLLCYLANWLQSTTDILDAGVKYMLAAANAGDRSAMLYVAKAYESGNGLEPGR